MGGIYIGSAPSVNTTCLRCLTKVQELGNAATDAELIAVSCHCRVDEGDREATVDEAAGSLSWWCVQPCEFKSAVVRRELLQRSADGEDPAVMRLLFAEAGFTYNAPCAFDEVEFDDLMMGFGWNDRMPTDFLHAVRWLPSLAE